MPQIDAQPILQLLGNHMAAKYLFTAHQIGLFTALADGPLDLDGLAAAMSSSAAHPADRRGRAGSDRIFGTL